MYAALDAYVGVTYSNVGHKIKQLVYILFCFAAARAWLCCKLIHKIVRVACNARRIPVTGSTAGKALEEHTQGLGLGIREAFLPRLPRPCAHWLGLLGQFSAQQIRTDTPRGTCVCRLAAGPLLSIMRRRKGNRNRRTVSVPASPFHG